MDFNKKLNKKKIFSKTSLMKEEFITIFFLITKLEL